LVDHEGLERVAQLVEGVLRTTADRPERLAYVAGAGTPPEEQTTGGYGAYLGTVPDFAPVDFGVRLSGVSGGSPAEEAGMQAGDILLRLGGLEIEDLYALTDALRDLEPGTEVQAVFVRDGQEVAVAVTLRERGRP
jgi:S1-C subfamily serine protease